MDEAVFLLMEAKAYLPLAAAFWNEDENPQVAKSGVDRTFQLIGRIDEFLDRYETAAKV